MLTEQPWAGSETNTEAVAFAAPTQLSIAPTFSERWTQPASGPPSTPPSDPPSPPSDPPSTDGLPPPSGGIRSVPPFVYEPAQAQRQTSARAAARGLIRGLFGRLEVRGKEGEDHLVEALLADQLLGEEGGQVVGRHLHRALAEEGRRGGRLRRGGSDQGRHFRR